MLDVPARLAAPSRGDDERNVQAHYDVSNEFFELMLDDTMTYSCAVFERPDASLREAQLAKIDRLCSKLDLGPGDHLVEIGSGWGGLAVHAAGRYGCRVTTTTVSEAQHSYVDKRVAEAGLADRVTVLGDDWRDLRGRFDKLVSVEMIEAVDWRHHDDFLAACSGLLSRRRTGRSPGHRHRRSQLLPGQAAQGLHPAPWCFPAAACPRLPRSPLVLARATDLRIVDLEDIGRHYAETLQRWAANLDSHEAQLQRLKVSTEFRRLWALYLAYCEAAFLERHVSDVQVVLAKPSWRGRLSARAA